MSAGRREARQGLPEGRKVIESAENPIALWMELLSQCEAACQKQSVDLMGRFYDVARWCWQSLSAEARAPVAHAFYEHFPKNPVLRRDMPRRWGSVVFTELRDVFRYQLSPEEVDAFEREFLEPEQRFVRRGPWSRTGHRLK